MSNIQLSDHFTYRRLLRFTLPSVIMLIFTSAYGVVDGIWSAVIVAELLAFCVSVFFFVKMRRRYQY